jgi:hypothetical protein
MAAARSSARSDVLDNDGRAIPARIGTDQARVRRIDIAAGRNDARLVERLPMAAASATQLLLLLDEMQCGASG